jgi:hypothetical protein
MLNKLVRIGTGLAGVLLLFLGLHCFLMPEVMLKALSCRAGGGGGPWMQATAMRDLASGMEPAGGGGSRTRSPRVLPAAL